jgi:hypothetical protein
MLSFLARHEVDKKGSTFGEQGKGLQAWNGWGGDAGFSWAKKIVGQMDARDKKTEFVAGRDCGQSEGGTFGPSNECAVGYGRPPLKGGYTPTRPGGKIPSDYKRPTPQGDKKETPKEEDQTASKRQDIQVVTKQEHLRAIKDSYKSGDGYEKEKLEIGEPEKGLVDDYRILSGGIWSKYERNLSSGMSQEKAFEDAINDSGNFPEDALNYATGSTLNKEDIKSIKDNLLKKNDGALKEYFNKSRQIAESKISEFNKLTNTPFSKEQTLYRGFRANNRQGKGFLEQVKKGGEIDFDSFMSTSSDPEVARRYARRETGATPKGESVLFKFKAKRGISTINSNNQERESNFKEVVLPKGKYKVASRKSIKTGDAITHFIEMEQI